jgi:hypothetical protein
MSDDETDRLKALDAVFAGEFDSKLHDHVRHSIQKHDASSALAAVSGIQDEALLRDLIDAGIRPETFASLSLLPLCEIAWADGDISSKEREAVLTAATQHGIESGSPARALLEHWLACRPELKMMDAWKEYIAALASRLPPDRAQQLSDEILGRARSIAATSGGILGFGAKVSVAEQFALDELERAFRP